MYRNELIISQVKKGLMTHFPRLSSPNYKFAMSSGFKATNGFSVPDIQQFCLFQISVNENECHLWNILRRNRFYPYQSSLISLVLSLLQSCVCLYLMTLYFIRKKIQALSHIPAYRDVWAFRLISARLVYFWGLCLTISSAALIFWGVIRKGLHPTLTVKSSSTRNKYQGN